MPQTKKNSGRRFTYGDYCSWPEDERWEVIEGVPFDMTPAPSRLHSLISGALEAVIRPFFADKSCEVHDAPFDVRLPLNDEPDEEVLTVVQPDILVVCDEKKLDDKGCRGAPDLIIEILSPSTASKDCIKKKALYEKHGVKEFWIVDPTNRIVTVYSIQPDHLFGKPIIYGEGDTVKICLFPGLEVDLGKVFPTQPRIIRESPAKYL